MNNILIAVFMSTGLFGNIDLPIKLQEALPVMAIYRYDKMIESQSTVGSTDKEHKIISNFLHENKIGWNYDSRSYAPGIIFKGPNFTINCIIDGIVINYQDEKSVWVQISKSVNISFCGLSETNKK